MGLKPQEEGVEEGRVEGGQGFRGRKKKKSVLLYYTLIGILILILNIVLNYLPMSKMNVSRDAPTHPFIPQSRVSQPRHC